MKVKVYKILLKILGVSKTIRQEKLLDIQRISDWRMQSL